MREFINTEMLIADIYQHIDLYGKTSPDEFANVAIELLKKSCHAIAQLQERIETERRKRAMLEREIEEILDDMNNSG